MRIDRSNKKKKIIIITLLGLLILAGGATAFALMRGNSVDPNRVINGVDYNPPTDEQKKSGNAAKKEFTDKAYPSESPSPQSQPGQTKDKVDISVTNHGPSGSVYQFRTLISTTTSGGTCTLTMTSDGRQTISKTINTQVMGSYTVCAGYFDIPLGDLAGATWKASVQYQNTQSEGSTSIDVKVD